MKDAWRAVWMTAVDMGGGTDMGGEADKADMGTVLLSVDTMFAM
jgi:hypothetical protein